jgi:hypothetical protein
MSNAKTGLPSHKLQSTTEQKFTMEWKTPKSELYSFNNSAETQVTDIS